MENESDKEKDNEVRGQVPPEIPQTPENTDMQEVPEIPESVKVDEEWAERLGVDFDRERVVTPPPVPGGAPGAAHPAQPIFVMDPSALQQPPVREPMPPTYMVWAILATVCCCLPAGIAAIVFSANVSSRYFARDYEGARRASRQAEIWIIVSIVTGVVFNALYLPLSLLMP